MKKTLTIAIAFLCTSASSTHGQSVWEQVTGRKPPVNIPVPTIKQLTNDPVRTLVNPTSYINQTGIPTQGDVFEFVIKNPDRVIELTQNPGNWPYVPVATAMIAARNAVINAGGSPIPPEIKDVLRRWYSEDLLNSVRWTTNWGPLQNTLQAAQMGFNGDTQAITVINAIIFRDDSLLSDAALWAHEVLHVQQYQQWGVFGFAKRWVDNSGKGGQVESPAYQREREVRRMLRDGTIRLSSNSSGQASPMATSGRIAQSVDSLPSPWVRCVFPADPTTYFVTVDNRIVAFPPGSGPVFIGYRTPPRHPNFAWTYQTQSVAYDVNAAGQIWTPFGPNGPMQVGHLTSP